MAVGNDPYDLDLFSATLISAYVDGNPRFRSRMWLARQMALHLRDPGCRFVLLTAPPGAGKSAFIASLAKQHPGWPRYFIRKDQTTQLNDPGSRSFLLKVGFQLAARFPELFSTDAVRIAVEQRLGSVDAAVAVEVGRLVASPFHQVIIQIAQQVNRASREVTGLRIGEWVTSPRLLPVGDLLYQALLDPAAALARTQPGKRIVVIVDGLDEIRYRDRAHSSGRETLLDWLAECPELPPNVRLLLTSRPDEGLLARLRGAQAPWLRELRIDAIDTRVHADLVSYAQALAAEPSVAGSLDPDAAPRFVNDAVEKADGNIGYLDAVARAVDNAVDFEGRRDALALALLPDTLAELNAHFLRQIRDRVGDTAVEVFDLSTAGSHYVRAWSGVHMRILGVLAVARRPLTPAEIRTLGGIGAEQTHVVDALGTLRQFLERTGASYRLYHTSLAQLLTDAATRENPELLDLYQDPTAWHARIAAFGVATIESLRRGGLPPSDVPPYILRHLGHHLEQSGADLSGLARLIDRPWLDAWRASDQLEWGVLHDVERVMRAAMDLNRQGLSTHGLAPGLHWEVTAALIRSSLVSISVGISPALLEAMLNREVWTEGRALAEVRQAPRLLERALGLITVAAARKKGELLDEAMDMIDLLEHEDRDAVRMAECLAAIAIGDLRRGLRAQREVQDEPWRTATLIAHAQSLTAVLAEETLLASLDGLSADSRSEVLVAWSLGARLRLRTALIRQVLATAEELFESDRAVTFLRIVAASPIEHAHLVDRALDIAFELSEWGMGYEYCQAIFSALPTLMPAQLERCLAMLERIADRGGSAGLAAAELVRQYSIVERRDARRWVLAELLSDGSARHSPEFFARWVDALDDEEVSALPSQLAEIDRLGYATVIVALADRAPDAEFDAQMYDLMLLLAGLDYDRRRQAERIAPHIPARRWSRVLEMCERIRADDSLPLTRPAGIVSRGGEQRKPMTHADRHAAMCEIVRAGAMVLPAELVPVAVRFAAGLPDAKLRCETLTALLPSVQGELQDSVARDALDAGQAAFLSEALRDVFPALPAGLSATVQRQAVAAAVDLWRGNRTAAVSSLAWKLDAEPLSELYQALHSIRDGWSWSKFVAAAAPLARPSVATACVEILLRERREDLAASVAAGSRLDDLPRLIRLHEQFLDATACADYLAALAPRLERAQLDEALAGLARRTVPLRDRIPAHRCLVVLARRCAELGHVRPALAAIERWPQEWVRAGALRAMSGLLAPDLAAPVEALVRNVPTREARALALCALAPFADDPGALRAEVLKIGDHPAICLTVLATGWLDEYDMGALWRRALDGSVRPLDYADLEAALTRSPPDIRCLALDLILERVETRAPRLFSDIKILPLLPRYANVHQMTRLAQLARGITDVHDWSRVAGPLLEHAAPETRDTLTAVARHERDAITDVVTARFAPEPVRHQVIETTMAAILRGDQWLGNYLSPLLVRQSVDDAYRHLSTMIRELPVHGRKDLLEAMATLAPAIGYVAGPEGTAEVLEAVERVRDWWP